MDDLAHNFDAFESKFMTKRSSLIQIHVRNFNWISNLHSVDNHVFEFHNQC